MNSPIPTGDQADASAVIVGSLALLASLTVLALVYLSDYSLGKDFGDQKPQFRQHSVTAIAEVP